MAQWKYSIRDSAIPTWPGLEKHVFLPRDKHTCRNPWMHEAKVAENFVP